MSEYSGLEEIDTPETVAESIRSGNYDNHLGTIIRAARDRKERLAITLGHQLTIGQRVVITSGRPHYIIGEKATVVRVMQKYVNIKFERSLGRFTTNNVVHCPMSMVRAI